MEIHLLFGYGMALLVGLLMGLAGGGGSVLTVPIFVYVFGIPPLLSTTYSLFVVGATSLVGAVFHLRQRRVDLRVAGAFALPSFASVYLTRRWLVPTLPDPLLRFGDVGLPKADALLLLFAVVMLVAAWGMIRRRPLFTPDAVAGQPPRYGRLAFDGLVVGLLTGTIGAGGGFLIVPMLVLLAGLPMHRAVATSVVIIAANSVIGFCGDTGLAGLHWPFLLGFTGLAVGGIFMGLALARKVAPTRLKRGFGWLVVGVALLMLGQEVVGLGWVKF